MKSKPSSILPSSYAPLLADLKARVRAAQVTAALSVNRELILLYWHIGREILRAQQAEGWGTKVVERLAKDLMTEFPEMSGFSSRNLKRMRTFAEVYAVTAIVPQPVAQLSVAATSEEIIQHAVGQSAESIVPQAVAKLVSRPVTQLRKAKVQQPVAPIVLQPVSKSEDALPEPLALLPWSTNLVLLHKLKVWRGALIQVEVRRAALLARATFFQ